MSDPIQVAIDTIEHYLKHPPKNHSELFVQGMNDAYYRTLSILRTLLSAQPEQRWIPCSERLPEDDTLMLVNYVDRRPDAMDIWIGWHEMENVWYIDGEAHSREYGNEVTAWMPLPKPYKEEGGQDG